jgi:hypothetical protein
MITDDEVMQMIEQANPVPPTDRGATRRLQASEVASYIAALRVSTTAISPSRRPTTDRRATQPSASPAGAIQQSAGSAQAANGI